MTDTPTKQVLQIYNVGQAGIAFALNEETGQTVFLSRQLCTAMGIDEGDVGRGIEAMVGEGAKGPQALTFKWIEELDDDVIEEFEERIAKLEKTVADLAKLV